MPRQKSTHVDSAQAVGRRLREARTAAGLSQRRLAFPGCTPAYISRIEAGERIPSLQLLRELGRRVGASADFLATGAAEPEGLDDRGLVEAEVALRLDDVELAERLYADALAGATDPHEQARAHEGLGQAAFRRGDHRLAVEQLERALALHGPGARLPGGLADTLGRAYAMLGESAHAIALFERALTAARDADDAVERLRFSVLLANALIDTGSFDRAEELLGDLLADVEELRDPIARARLYWSQSRLHALQDEPHTAARFAHRALEILELTEHTHYTARAHQLLAHIELDRSRPEVALELLRSGRELLGAGGNRHEEAKFKLEEARALAQLGEHEEAASMAMAAAGTLADTDPAEAGRGYGLAAAALAQAGEDSRARELYELAAELLERTPNRYLVEIYARLADLLERSGETDEALALLKRALGVRTAADSRSA